MPHAIITVMFKLSRPAFYFLLTLLATALYILSPCQSQAQMEDLKISNRSEVVRALYRYPAIYAECRLSSKRDGKFPLLGLTELLRRKPKERLFTLDWHANHGQALYRVHFDRRRNMLWFQALGVSENKRELDDCFVFSRTTLPKLSRLARKERLLASRKKTGYPVDSLSDNPYLLWFNQLVKAGCERKALRRPERPEFGSRRELF